MSHVAEEDRDHLILSHLWVVRSVAAGLKESLLYSADWDELISAGNLALVKAADRYEARNGCQFKTYAYKFVRGDMIRSFTRIDGHHDSALIEFTPLADHSIDPVQENVYYDRERRQLLTRFIDCLKPRHREVISAFLGGESLVQLARNKGVKRDRLMKWQRTGIKQLIVAGESYRAQC